MGIMVYKLNEDTEPVELSDFQSENSLDDISRKLPQGVYSTFRTYDGASRVLGLRRHLDRLYIPCKNNGVKPSITSDSLRIQLKTLLQEYRPDEVKIRVCVSLTEFPGQVILMIEKFNVPDERIYKDGVKVITAYVERDNPRLKSTLFIKTSAIERSVLLNDEIYEILRLKGDCILEGFTSNFYALINSKIITARKDILLGVTRTVVIRLIRLNKLALEYRPLHFAEISDIKEAFITSSSRGVVPVISIDGKSVGQGGVGHLSKKLREDYDAYVIKNAELI